MERKKPNRSPESLARKAVYNAEYQRENYETFLVRVKKGRKEVYQDLAASRDMSLNGLIVELLENKLKEEQK